MLIDFAVAEKRNHGWISVQHLHIWGGVGMKNSELCNLFYVGVHSLELLRGSGPWSCFYSSKASHCFYQSHHLCHSEDLVYGPAFLPLLDSHYVYSSERHPEDPFSRYGFLGSLR
jgi:hypothetical protein